ncbi:glycosyltransferase family 2 protein [Pedobacter psychrodurus]|uniref:Glycosyltransferase family 2 protein n=1 Tax=Pedobacter psychrodurus TaxID=2530456 RepID=A0A4R0PK26_9SPHI|nr:glycosyltransferase family A protein [Pedobacter psychrodurus]TCD17342.1 glycosyltransferase family 2 protein [Pedobacter psychrodurus]
MNSLVSIIVPCYNQANFLAETLDCVLAQEFKDWECIIVNDGSPDNTEGVANSYCNEDSRFKYFYKTNGGLSSARNFGIGKSAGKYILPLDSDDKIASDYIKLAVEILEKNERIKVVYGRAELFGKKSGEWIIDDYSFNKLLATNLIYCSALYRRSDYDRTTGYNENMKFGFEDWDFWLSMLESGGDVYRIDKVMFYYRIRHGSMLRSLDREKQNYLRNQLYENHRKAYSEYLLDPLNTFEYTTIYSSVEYRVGKMLLTPIRRIFKFFRK